MPSMGTIVVPILYFSGRYVRFSVYVQNLHIVIKLSVYFIFPPPIFISNQRLLFLMKIIFLFSFRSTETENKSAYSS